MTETIFLTPKKKTTAEIRAGLPLPLRVLTSPVTTAVLGATLGALLFPASALASAKVVGKALVPKTLKGALIAGVTVPTAVGVLSSSKKAREIVKTTLDPRESIKRGKKGKRSMPIGQGPEPPTYNPEEEKEQKRLKELDDWWENLEFSQRNAILGEYDDNETLSREQQYDEEWNDMTLEGREEIYRDWKDIY